MEKRFILDKNNRQIEIGDVLKIYHFTGSRRKKYFMYKQVLGFSSYKPKEVYEISHLNMNTERYWLLLDGKKHDDIEIIQSCTKVNFENRRQER